MNNEIITGVIISTIFFIIKFIEMRFIQRENVPLKTLVINTLIVFVSTILSLMIMKQFNIDEIIGSIKSVPSVFTGKPDF
tara:strand:+ start:6718 stop:6957 length:240 start_codon:yes stop_codon:yes gene_type:complete